MNNQDDRPGYGYQIKKGATSLTEKWDARIGDFGSQNHFMSGQINEWLFNNLVGISPTESGPGFREFSIKPDFIKGLDYVKGYLNSISGDVQVAWKRISGRLELDVVVPANTHAMLYLPVSDPAEVFEGNKSVSRSLGIKVIQTAQNQSCFSLGSGKYHFAFKTNN